MNIESFDIFLSYARADVAQADRLRLALKESGWTVFVDSEGIDGGVDFPTRLHEALQRSRLVVCCWSPASFGSEWCLHEARYAKRRNKLVPVVLESLVPVDLPPDLEFANYFDLSRWDGSNQQKAWQLLAADLQRRLPSQPNDFDRLGDENERFIRSLPKRLDAAFVVWDHLFGGSTSDMVEACDRIIESLRVFWIELEQLRDPTSFDLDAAGASFDAQRAHAIQNLPPRDPMGGTIQRIEAASSVMRAMGALIENRVGWIWPPESSMSFESWRRDWQSRL